jgi:protein SCO1/2
MTERLAGVHRALGDRVDVVSVSIDPAYDTPERLAAFARAHGAEAPRWHFLTGDSGQVQEAVLRGFKIAFSRESEDITSITHGCTSSWSTAADASAATTIRTTPTRSSG